jgi:hypothetical protein
MQRHVSGCIECQEMLLECMEMQGGAHPLAHPPAHPPRRVWLKVVGEE